MITVTRHNDGISVKGHAGYAERGKDIVCAAVSALVQTLIQSVEDLTTDKIEYSMTPGAVLIKFGCLSDHSRVLIDAFFIGIKQIADNYPNHVKLTEH